jgi:hypothetical protein
MGIAGRGGEYPQIGMLGFGQLALLVRYYRLIVEGPQIHQGFQSDAPRDRKVVPSIKSVPLLMRASS